MASRSSYLVTEIYMADGGTIGSWCHTRCTEYPAFERKKDCDIYRYAVSSMEEANAALKAISNA